MTDLDLNAIRARAENATEGPWEVGGGWVFTMPVYDDDNRLSDVLGTKFADPVRAAAERERAQRNAEFIAHARTDVPALLAEVERLKDMVAEFRKREQSQDRIRDRLTADRDRLRAALNGDQS